MRTNPHFFFFFKNLLADFSSVIARCKYADDFMKAHQLAYDATIQNMEDTASMPRVKVAVLDTGLDLDHPDIQANRERIKEVKAWLPPETTRSEGDVSGHGTHVTSLLLAIAPDCDVYVVKIAEHQPTSPAQIAKVKFKTNG